MSTTRGVPSDANGWVTYEFISRSDGTDEIRLTYEKSHQQERLLMTPKKWLLFRNVPNADHLLDEENIGTGEFVIPENTN